MADAADDGFVKNDDFENILRSKQKILTSAERKGIGPTPNELSQGVVTEEEVNEALTKHAERTGIDPPEGSHTVNSGERQVSEEDRKAALAATQ